MDDLEIELITNRCQQSQTPDYLMTSLAGNVRAIWHCCVGGVDLTPFTNRSVVYIGLFSQHRMAA